MRNISAFRSAPCVALINTRLGFQDAHWQLEWRIVFGYFFLIALPLKVAMAIAFHSHVLPRPARPPREARDENGYLAKPSLAAGGIRHLLPARRDAMHPARWLPSGARHWSRSLVFAKAE